MMHMERKDYKLEIVNALLKSQNHVRGAAKGLGGKNWLYSPLSELLFLGAMMHHYFWHVRKSKKGA
jgi:hypothetical protein